MNLFEAHDYGQVSATSPKLSKCVPVQYIDGWPLEELQAL